MHVRHAVVGPRMRSATNDNLASDKETKLVETGDHRLTLDSLNTCVARDEISGHGISSTMCRAVRT